MWSACALNTGEDACHKLKFNTLINKNSMNSEITKQPSAYKNDQGCKSSIWVLKASKRLLQKISYIFVITMINLS
jgi:hypothetical protein